VRTDHALNSRPGVTAFVGQIEGASFDGPVNVRVGERHYAEPRAAPDPARM